MDLFEQVKILLSGYYDGNNGDVYVPENMVLDVFSLLCSSANRARVWILNHSNIKNNKFLSASVENKSVIDIENRIVLPNVKQFKDIQHEDIISVFSSFVLLSNVKVEQIREVFSFAIFDEKIVFILENDDDGGYYISNSSDSINKCLKLWSLDTVSLDCINSMFLQEPLMFSADMMSEISKVLCSADHMDKCSCEWYHSTWQYLRLMNMVSTPSWHHDFYIEQLTSALLEKTITPKVLISGTADYSSFSYVVRVSKDLKIDSEYYVLDMCKTPLFMCKWYARRENVQVRTIQSNIFEFKEVETFDLIVTDAFLTRFKSDELLTILQIWNKALKKDGQIITTIRVHDENHLCPEIPHPDDVERFKQKALYRSKVWSEFINYDSNELAERASLYAKQMKSNSLGTKQDIFNAFSVAGFSIYHCEDVELEGELYFSRYLRICARKEI